MSQNDVLIEELIESSIEGLLQDDPYYNLHATVLKPAIMIKQEHRKQLQELFKLRELRADLDKAQKLILNMLPRLIPAEEFTQIKQEIEGSGEHFVHFAESISPDSDKTIFLQEMFGLSDTTLLHAYDLASDLVEKGNYEDAHAIFVFLSTLAPYVSSYWIAQGICLKAMKRSEEALTAFNAARLLNESNPVPVAHIIECYITTKENDKARGELETLNKIISTLSSDEKVKWEQISKDFKV